LRVFVVSISSAIHHLIKPSVALTAHQWFTHFQSRIRVKEKEIFQTQRAEKLNLRERVWETMHDRTKLRENKFLVLYFFFLFILIFTHGKWKWIHHICLLGYKCALESMSFTSRILLARIFFVSPEIIEKNWILIFWLCNLIPSKIFR